MRVWPSSLDSEEEIVCGNAFTSNLWGGALFLCVFCFGHGCVQHETRGFTVPFLSIYKFFWITEFDPGSD